MEFCGRRNVEVWEAALRTLGVGAFLCAQAAPALLPLLTRGSLTSLMLLIPWPLSGSALILCCGTRLGTTRFLLTV